MRLNGLSLVVSMAARSLAHPLVSRYEKALVLGAMREDVWYLPLFGEVVEHLSLSHFYQEPLPGGIIPLLTPSAPSRAQLFFGRARGRWAGGDRAGAFVQLGRVAHLVADMACPVHATRTPHLTDPYEWYVEAHRRELGELPVPEVSAGESARAIVESMARHGARHRPDTTNHHLGRLLRAMGLRRPVSPREAGEQARELIPLAAGHTAAVVRLFLAQAGEPAQPSTGAETVSRAR